MSEDSTNRKQGINSDIIAHISLLMIASSLASDRWGKEIGDLATAYQRPCGRDRNLTSRSPHRRKYMQREMRTYERYR